MSLEEFEDNKLGGVNKTTLTQLMAAQSEIIEMQQPRFDEGPLQRDSS